MIAIPRFLMMLPRWVPTNRLVGDYDGREHTLQIFNADPKEAERVSRQHTG
jgi:hypothetical protein